MRLFMRKGPDVDNAAGWRDPIGGAYACALLKTARVLLTF
jgi:hypothetical protein